VWQRGRDKLPSILGTPRLRDIAGGEAFDGNTGLRPFRALTAIRD